MEIGQNPKGSAGCDVVTDPNQFPRGNGMDPASPKASLAPAAAMPAPEHGTAEPVDKEGSAARTHAAQRREWQLVREEGVYPDEARRRAAAEYGLVPGALDSQNGSKP